MRRGVRWGIAAVVMMAGLTLAAGVTMAAGLSLPAGTTLGEIDRERPDPGSPPCALNLRIMTFNIRYGTADDGDNAWRKRRELLLETIRTDAPDILGLQEALRFQLDEMGAAFKQYGEIGVGRDDGKQAGEYAAILYDKERLEPTESGTFWLSDTPEVPGSASWGNHVTRIVTWAHFRDRTCGRSLYVFDTHWDHESQISRERSAALLRERIRTRGAGADPVLVMGDFNVGEDHPAFLALVRGGGAEAGAGAGSAAGAAAGAATGADSAQSGSLSLRDTYRVIHPDAGEVGTYHAFTGDRKGEKIDAILASPEWKVLDAEIIRVNHEGRYPSDHFPVRATAVLGP
jgi:endonuclease/exonuclease/phosphatase family metal-dependent hydrolase